MRNVFVLLGFLFAFFVSQTFAADEFRTDYTVDYHVNNDGGTISTQVNFNTKVTNLQSELYVDNYQLSFPSSFNISNITASDDKGSITPNVKTEDNMINIKMKINDPKIGTNTSNDLLLKFTQDNLFRINGNVWEVMLPTITGRQAGNYQVRVHLPPTDKRIAIAKPKPTKIENNVIYWDNPQVKTIYAVFGDKQFYSLDLSYHLANEKLVPVYTEIAFPPDMLHQQIFVDRVEPPPTSVRVDEDGNYMARYDLKPKQKLDVRFRGYAQVFTQPRDELRKIVEARFEKQKGYMLREDKKYWTLSNPASYDHLDTAEAAYKSVVGSLSYDYDRLKNNKSYRLGADTALKNPTRAVCVEFTDAFIALTRSNGVYSREIEGFGFSQDERLRPLSLISDVLHSWPEYYDEENRLWKQVDPTWENTSGIDYFSSFDLDHIAFAIHGKDPEDPPPAGTYKLEDSRDVTVKVAANLPDEDVSLSVKNMSVKTVVSDKDKYKGTVEVVNTGNVTAYDVPITIESAAFKITPDEIAADELPPLGSKKVPFTYSLKSGLTPKEGSITVRAGDGAALTRAVRITPLAQTITIAVSAAVAVILLILLLFFSLHRRKR